MKKHYLRQTVPHGAPQVQFDVANGIEVGAGSGTSSIGTDTQTPLLPDHVSGHLIPLLAHHHTDVNVFDGNEVQNVNQHFGRHAIHRSRKRERAGGTAASSVRVRDCTVSEMQPIT